MPNDGNTITLDVKVEDWIKKFNKAKGWDSLKVPRPEVLDWRDEEQEFRKSGEERFERKLDALGDKGDLTREIDEAKKSKSDLELQRVAAKTEEDREKIDKQIADLEDAIRDKTAERTMVEKLEKMLETVRKVEENLSDDLKKQQDRIQELEEELDESEFDIDDLSKTEKGKNDVQGFIKFHDDVARNIDNFRQEVIPLTETGKNGLPVTSNYAVINSEEYKILFGILEEGRLQFQLGKLDVAMGLVQKAQDQMWVYRNARTGAEKVTPPETFGRKIDVEIELARQGIGSLRNGGYERAADKHQLVLDDLEQRLRGAIASKKSDIEKTFLGEAERLAEGCAMDVESMGEIRTYLAKAMQHVEAMRVNGHSDRPQRVVDRIAKFIPGADLDPAVDEAEKIADYALELLERTKERDLEDAKVDPEQLEKEFGRLTDRYDALFKHDKGGNIRTQKDTKTGQDKGVKKNADLPRETLEEIDLRIKSAEQLLSSDSVDALKLAKTYVGNINIFLDNIEKNPKVYSDFADWLKELTTKMNGIEKDYGLFEVAKRADLKADLDKLKKDYMTKPQGEVKEKIAALEIKIGDYKKLVSGLRSQEKTLVKLADGVEKTLGKMGDVLKKDYTITSAPTKDEAKFNGYYGHYSEDLAEGRGKIERRTAETLKDAETFLTQLKLDTDRGLKLLEDYVAFRKKNKGKMTEGDVSDVKDLMKDAGNGQQKHNENEKAKPTFEKAVEELERQAEIVKGLQEKLKADPSTREALEGEVEAIRKEVKADGTYVEGLERLKPLSARMAKLLLEASGATEIVDAKLPDAAKLVVKHVNAYRDGVKAFYAKTVHPAADGDNGNEIDKGVYDAKKIGDFLNSIVAAIPQKALDELADATGKVADTGLSKTERKASRKTALAAVRSLVAVLDGFKPAAHFRLHTFSDVNALTAYNAARQGLPRLEVRLLTAIAD